MIPDAKPDADGLYWKKRQDSLPWVFVVMIPAMIGTWLVIAWAALALLMLLF